MESTLTTAQLLGAAASAGTLLDGIFKQAAFSQILLFINLILLGAATIWLSYNLVAGLVQSAWEGEFLGKRFHSVWMPIRVSVGFAALLPVIGGWSASQYIVYQTAKMGAGAANIALGAAGAALIDNSLLPSGGGGEKQLALQAFGTLLCRERVSIAAQRAAANGDGLIGMDEFYGVQDCGQIEAPAGELQSAHAAAAAAMAAALASWASVEARGQEGLQEPPSRAELIQALDGAATAYSTAIRTAAAALEQEKRSQLDAGAAGQNWLTYGFQTVKAAQAQQQVSRAAGASATVQGKGNNSSAGREAAAATAGLGAGTGAATTTGGGGSGWDQIMKVKDNPSLLFKLAFGNATAGAPSLGGGGLIQSLAALGSWLIAIAWSALAFFLVVLAVLALGSFLSAGAIPLALYAGGIVLGIAVPLAVMGITLAVYVPMLPAFLWTLGIVAWLLVVAEGLFLAPVWAFCHLEGEGEGMGQRSEKGYAFLLDLLLRPLLLVGSFAIAGGVLNAAWSLFSESLGGVLSMTDSSSVTTFVMWIGMMFLVTTLAVQLVGTVYRKCLDLPDQVAAWLGHSASSYVGDHSTRDVEPSRPNLPNLPQRQGGSAPRGGGDAPATPKTE